MLVVMWIGIVISGIAGIWLLIEAFRVSILWGLASIFIPFVSLFFIIVHWDRARKPSLWALLGCGLVFVSVHMQARSVAQAELDQISRTAEP